MKELKMKDRELFSISSPAVYFQNLPNMNGTVNTAIYRVAASTDLLRIRSLCMLRRKILGRTLVARGELALVPGKFLTSDNHATNTTVPKVMGFYMSQFENYKFKLQ